MIEDIYGKHGKTTVVCDNCNDGFECENFNEAIEHMKEDGWQKTFKHGHYEHYCPDCKE